MWSAKQVHTFAERAKRSVGKDGWELLVPRLRQALVAEECLRVCRMQTAPVSVEQMDWLLSEMLSAAGVED